VEEPKSLRKWGFWDSLCHSEWPKVADAVIKARRWLLEPQSNGRCAWMTDHGA